MRRSVSNTLSRLKQHDYQAMGAAILCQVFGTFSTQAIEQNGLLVLYLRKLGLSASLTLSILSGFSLILSLLRVPSSHIADTVGRKRLGIAGTIVGTISLIMVALSGFLDEGIVRGVVIASVLVFALGQALFTTGWFSVLHPIIPGRHRGKFFGVLRFSWQTSGILFGAAAALLLNRFPEVWMYQIVFGGIAAGSFIRAILYRRLPELEETEEHHPSFVDAVRRVFRQEGFGRYVVYIAVRFLCLGAVLQVLALLEREVLGLADGSVVMLANLGLVGNLAGYVTGTLSVDRLGRRPFFVGTHGVLALVILAFPARVLLSGLPVVPMYAALHVCYGFLFAAFSVAMTTEEFNLVKTRRKALAFAFAGLSLIGGMSVSRFLSSLLLHPTVLPAGVQLGRYAVSNYDVVLLILGGALLLSLPLAGIVPGVRRQAAPQR
jgi:MFS family permease